MAQYLATTTIADILRELPKGSPTAFFNPFSSLMVVDVYSTRTWGELVDGLWEKGYQVTNDGYIDQTMTAHYIKKEGRIVGYALNKVSGEYSYVIESDKVEPTLT